VENLRKVDLIPMIPRQRQPKVERRCFDGSLKAIEAVKRQVLSISGVVPRVADFFQVPSREFQFLFARRHRAPFLLPSNDKNERTRASHA
jgi:hypothetical protein